MINAVIVDDEKGARESLAKMVEKYCPQIHVAAKADSMKTALEAIELHRPDLVFLDIEMPNGNAFDLLESVPEINFEIIFTTAYDNYAIKAIKFSAIDYILKPIDPEELVIAVDRLKNKVNQKELIRKKFDTLLSNISPGNITKKIALPEGDSYIFINLSDIIRCESANNYTIFYLTDGRQIVVTRSLGDYEQMLLDDDFLRIHRSHMINFNHLKKFVKGDNAYLIMDDDAKVEISRRGKADLLDKIANK